MKRHLRFDDEAAAPLRELLPRVEHGLEDMAATFYEGLRELDGSGPSFVQEGSVARLQRSFVDWLRRTMLGPLDERFDEETCQIGRLLALMGVPEHQLSIAMARLRLAFVELVERDAPAHAGPAQAAVSRAFDIALALMISAQHDERAAEASARATEVRRRDRLSAVGTLGAGLAHELRNPLNGVRLHTTFIERSLERLQVKDADTLDAVRVVRSEIERLSRLVDEFLEFARPKPFTKESKGVAELCERARQAALARRPVPEIEIVFEAPVEDLVVQVDAARIEQVVENLIDNAVEALAGRRRGKVVVRARRQARAAIIEVEDDGPGLDPEEQRVFDAFFTTKSSGTGMGLAVAHRTVTDHDGRLTFESRPGKTTFRVTLPLAVR